ncbi:hypothetical protein MANAM107_10940 [Actinomyces capricornis]|uniref:Uncharacterized protein n=1 Tax=Actinomyces capricornis TaxID=2755559 RepID=A0ABN6K8B6_9ACTO|nr:hypothetical protein MANAM107_10940 [Actinomyces capricornis]
MAESSGTCLLMRIETAATAAHKARPGMRAAARFFTPTMVGAGTAADKCRIPGGL